MECARLSDAELLPLLREESEASRGALRELERRHFRAVRTFAALCTLGEDSADELADNAWRRATTLPEGARVGAMRPHALCSVIRTTADWAGTARRSDLHDELVRWMQSYVSEGRGDSSADDFPRTSMAARAFGSLADHSQTVLWHYAVEFDGVARIDQLLGGGTDEVTVLERRARREFYNAYVRLHEEEIRDDECRGLRRTMLAYADQKPIETGAELLPHLERCAHCSQAVDDLGLMQVHCGALLAEALLPWGGPEYAAAGFPSASGRSAAGGAADGDARYAGGAGAGAAATAGSGAGGAADGDRPDRSYEGRLTSGFRKLVRRGLRGGTARLRSVGAGAALAGGAAGAASGAGSGGGAESAGAPPGGAGPRPGDGRRRHRTKRAAQSAAVVALCSLVVAVAYTGAFRPGSPQSSETPPAQSTTQAPARPPGSVPTTATATATSTVTTTETAPPPRGGAGDSPGGSGTPPRGGALPAGAALEWLFDQVDGATAVDTSANGVLGTLFGDPLPALVNGALEFSGSQEVGSETSVLDTERSFSVSARVKLSDKGGTQAVLSQDGNRYSAFVLRYDAEQDSWSMGLRDSDGEDTETDVALSESRPRTGIWTYLTGVYDDAENEIRLYVDGELEDRSEHDGDWPAEGSFAVGRALLEGRPAQGLRGTVDDVRAFSRALSGREARALAAGG